jgi:hypothetical protein
MRAVARPRNLGRPPATPGVALKSLAYAGSPMIEIQAWTNSLSVAPLALSGLRPGEEPSTRTRERQACAGPETRPESVELSGDVRSD